MGDNIWLGDRDGVRTPMQWTPDRNGGFSTADPQRMYLPLNQDPVYGYQVTNVESQLRNTNSLLQWIRRMIQVRNQHPTFGLGTFEEIGSRNPTVLSLRPRVRRRRRAVRQQPVPVPAAGGAGPAPVRGLHAGRADRPGGVPADRRPALHAHARRARLLLVRAGQADAPAPDEHEDWESATSSAVADSLLAAGVVSAAEETPGDSAPGTDDAAGGTAMNGADRPASASGCRTSAGSAARAGSGPTSPRTASSSTAATRCSRCTASGSTYTDGGRETYLVPLSWRDHPADELSSAFVGAVANDGRRDLRLRRDARPRGDRARG